VRDSVTALVERVWAARSSRDHALRAALLPAAAVYGAAVRVRNRLYDTGWLAARRVPALVLGVGNLAVGGTGKTPAALWLAERLSSHGRRVAIVSRGYRKRRPGTVVVGTDGVPLVGPEDGGDEAVMLARRFRGPVVVGERRADAAALACERFAADTIVLDDGFQHRALARDADLVLVAGDPSTDHLLPAGPLREPVSSLRRARAVLAVGGDGTLPPRPIAPPGIRTFRARLIPTAIVRAANDWMEEPLATLTNSRVVAVAGIAHPGRFTSLLSAVGATVEQSITFPDHHTYQSTDIARITHTARNLPILTTEKDLVKLSAHLPDIAALRVSLDVEDADALLDHLLATTPNQV